MMKYYCGFNRGLKVAGESKRWKRKQQGLVEETAQHYAPLLHIINIGTRKPRDSIANVCAFHDFSNTQQYIINQQPKINDQYFIERFIRNCL